MAGLGCIMIAQNELFQMHSPRLPLNSALMARRRVTRSQLKEQRGVGSM